MSSLPMWWSFMKYGAHDIANKTREAAWGIHATLGFVFLIFSSFHGVQVLREYEGRADQLTIFHLLGCFALMIMWASVVPALLHSVFPDFLRYDKFKLFHYLAFLGYLLAVVYMCDHACNFQTVRTWILAVV